MSKWSIPARLFWLAILLLAILIVTTGFLTYQVISNAEVIEAADFGSIAKIDGAVRNARATVGLSVIVSVIAFLSAALLAALVIRSITSPLRRIERSIADITNGKRDVILPAPGPHEIGAMTRALAMLRNSLTERDRLEQRCKRAEAEAAQVQARFKDAIETLYDGFALYDAQDRLVICNGRYREMYEAAEVDIAPGMHREAILRAAATAGIVSPEKGSDALLGARIQRRRRRVGRHEPRHIAGRWFKISERPTADGGMVGVFTDVTEQQANEKRLSALSDELTAAREQILQDVAVKQRILAGMGGKFDSMDDIGGLTHGKGNLAQPATSLAGLITRIEPGVELAIDPRPEPLDDAFGGERDQGLAAVMEAPERAERTYQPQALGEAPVLALSRADVPRATAEERVDGVEDVILTRMVSILSQAFPTLSRDELRAIAAVASWFSVPGGGCLYQQGAESDSLCIVASGMLGAYRIDSPGREKLLGRIGVGETVGEMGFLTHDPRTATVRALRNSELVRIARAELPDLAFKHPAVLTELCSTVVSRLRDVQERGPSPVRPKTFCIIPHDADIDVRAFAAYLTGASGSDPLVLLRGDVEGNTAEWFFHREHKHNPILYVADPHLSTWTRFCLRQADQIVLLARGEAHARPFAALGPNHNALPTDIACDLVLLWDRTIPGSKTAAWLDLIKPRAHYHVRTRLDGARVGRLVTRRATGLVLSGGGARGFAHLGVLRALKEHGIGIDAIGGASMGALIGAGIALEWEFDAMISQCVDGFLSRPYLSDIGISRSALFSGKKLRRLFDEWFGEVRIEETPLKYYCVSTNLTNGTLSVHTSGKLANWVRASSAIPGMFPPVVNEGVVHVDGGVLDNLPVDVMRGLGVETVIGVNVESEEVLVADGKPPPVLELLKRVATIASDSKAGSDLRKCDMLITPRVQHIGLLDWREYGAATESGYRAAVECLTDLGHSRR
jgi:NTE family protein